MKRVPTLHILLALALALAGAAPAARAGLGEPASSISTDQSALGASRRLQDARGTHRIERLVSDARTVREFVTPAGTVFAVCWDGVTHPDLPAVLGAYAAPVRRAVELQRTAPRGRVLHVESGGAVLETWGHMRDLHGCAHVPALIPPGVTADEIR
jgi:hypothetical protein